MLSNRWKDIAAGKRPSVWLVFILVLLCASLSFVWVEKPENVQYFGYDQMTSGRLKNLIYDEKTDLYTVTESPASVGLRAGKNTELMNYLYLDYDKANGGEDLWKLLLIKDGKHIVFQQELVLHSGENEIILPAQEFEWIRFVSEQTPGEQFRLENVELRTQGRDFLVKRFLLIFLATFAVLAAGLFWLTKNTKISRLADIIREAEENIDSFLGVLGDTVSFHMSYRKKRILRAGIFLLILLYITYIQKQGQTALILHFSMNMWLVGGMLLILAGLCYEKGSDTTDRSALHRLLLLFLAFVFVSDFFVAKRFLYAGFGMFFMGGLFARAWRSMEQPEDLAEEFRWAYIIYFVLGIGFCFLFRPLEDGICYRGFFTDARLFGIASLAAAIVFMSDFLKRSKEGLGKVSAVRMLMLLAEGIGAVAASYFLWKTQQIGLVLIGLLILGAGAVFWLAGWLKAPGRSKLQILFASAVCLAVGILFALGINQLLYMLPYRLGTARKFQNDVVETLELGIADAFARTTWKKYFLDELLICKSTLQNLNMLGHYNTITFWGDTVWPANSIVMNMFRYGLAAGTVYGIMTVFYFAVSVRSSVKQNQFFLLGISCAGVLTGMLAMTEFPFSNMNWYLFYFGMCYLSAVKGNAKRLKGSSGMSEMIKNKKEC